MSPGRVGRRRCPPWPPCMRASKPDPRAARPRSSSRWTAPWRRISSSSSASSSPQRSVDWGCIAPHPTPARRRSSSTRTEVVSVPRGERSTVIRRYGATCMASKVEGGSVSFQTGGDTDRVLLFRAVNSRGQPLASQGGYSGHFLFGEGISGEKDYAGAVDRVEVVFAAETQTLEFPFTLTKTSLAGKPGNTFPDRTPPFRPYGYEAIRAESLTGRRGPGPDGWKRLSPPAKPESHRSLALLG